MWAGKEGAMQTEQAGRGDGKRRPRMRNRRIVCQESAAEGGPCGGVCRAGSSRESFTWYRCQTCGRWRKVPRPKA